MLIILLNIASLVIFFIMKINDKNRQFIKKLTKMLEYSKACALELEELVFSLDKVHERVEHIDMLESEADHLLHEFTKELSQAEIKGRHKDKLLSLANGIDDITDSIELVANNIEIYSFNCQDDSASELCALLVRASEMLIKASTEFPSRSDQLIRSVIDVNQLEEAGDRIFHSAMSGIFSDSGLSPTDVIRMKEIYSSLEAAMNACEAVADTFDSLTVVRS